MSCIFEQKLHRRVLYKSLFDVSMNFSRGPMRGDGADGVEWIRFCRSTVCTLFVHSSHSQRREQIRDDPYANFVIRGDCCREPGGLVAMSLLLLLAGGIPRRKYCLKKRRMPNMFQRGPPTTGRCDSGATCQGPLGGRGGTWIWRGRAFLSLLGSPNLICPIVVMFKCCS